MNINCTEKKLSSACTVYTNKSTVFKNIICMYCNNVFTPFHKMLFTTCFNKKQLKIFIWQKWLCCTQFQAYFTIDTVTFNYINLIFNTILARRKFHLKAYETNPKKYCQQVSGGDSAPLFHSHEIPPEILEYCIQFWDAQHREDIDLSE